MAQTTVNDLGYMGKYARAYRPRPTAHRFLNEAFGKTPSRAVLPSALVLQQKKIPDVSFWQGDINFQQMRQKTDAVIIRAGQRNWVDSEFKDNWQKAKDAGLLRGSYWFYDDRENPGKQAEIWAELLHQDPPEMEIWADWENTYGGSFGGLRNVVAFMQAMERFLPTLEIGIYTGYWWFREHSNSVTNAAQYEYLKRKPLFEAWYTSNAANVLIPPPWTSMHLWQFGTPAVGHEYGVETAEIDMSFINMSETDFNLKYRSGVVLPPTTPPTPPVVIEPETLPETWTGRVVSAIRMRVRSYPVTTPAAETGLYLGYAQRVSGKLWEGNGYLWMKLDNTNPEAVRGKWVAVRKTGGEKFIRLDEHPKPPIPPTNTRRLPSGRKFGRLKFDFQRYGVSRPTRHGHGPATLGKPQTIKVLYPVGMPMTFKWQMYWADLFSLEHYRRLYRDLSRGERDFINNALLGATEGWRAVTNHHGHNDGYAEYWTRQNEGKPPMQQETITFGGAVVELVTGQKVRKGGKDVYEVYTLDGNQDPPDALKVNQFTDPSRVCYGNISRREKLMDARGKWTGKWREDLVIHWPQLPTGVPICFMGVGPTNFIEAEWVEILPDNALVPKPVHP